MKKSRIVIIGWADSVHVQRWCRGLSERGFNIKLISAGGRPLSDIETVILPHSGNVSYLLNIGRARKEVRSFRPDLVHAHYVAGNGLWGLCAKVRPLVSSVWGSDIDSKSNSFVVNQIVKKVLTSCNRVTVTSEYLKAQTLMRMNDTDVPITVIPFGVNIPSIVRPLPPLKPFKLCYLKSHKPVYGPDILIDAMGRVVKLFPEVTLTLAGEPNAYTQTLKEKIAELKLENNINIAGFINYTHVPDFISEHHVMVMPSRLEGFGVAAAEAGACGRAAIATNVGGIPEVVKDDKTGVLVPPNDSAALADAILKLANDLQLCHKMGLAGYEFIKKSYDWEKSLDQMSELYESVIYERRQNKN